MDLSALNVGEPEKLIAAVSGRLRSCRSVEGACSVLAADMYERCRLGGAGARMLLLSRIFLSLPLQHLDPETATQVRGSVPAGRHPDASFLTLMATCGKVPEWCDRRKSGRHRAIPLGKAGTDAHPMLRSCLKRIGVDASASVSQRTVPDGVWVPLGLFLVEEALGSPDVPDQDDFVKAHQVRSVVGCGAVLPDGAVSLWIGFSRQPLTEDGAMPLLTLMPAFWHVVHPLYRRRALFG